MRTTEAFENELSALLGFENNRSDAIRRAVHLLHYLKVVQQATDLTITKPDGTQLTVGFK